MSNLLSLNTPLQITADKKMIHEIVTDINCTL